MCRHYFSKKTNPHVTADEIVVVCSSNSSACLNSVYDDLNSSRAGQRGEHDKMRHFDRFITIRMINLRTKFTYVSIRSGTLKNYRFKKKKKTLFNIRLSATNDCPKSITVPSVLFILFNVQTVFFFNSHGSDVVYLMVCSGTSDYCALHTDDCGDQVPSRIAHVCSLHAELVVVKCVSEKKKKTIINGMIIMFITGVDGF